MPFFNGKIYPNFKFQMKKSKACFLFIIYLCALFKITIFRANFTLSKIFQAGEYNFTPFADYAKIWDLGALKFIYLFFGNIIWFVPFGLFARYFFPNFSMRKILIFGLLLSLIIEILQFVFKSGIFELDDLILNVFGVFLGVKFGGILKFRQI